MQAGVNREGLPRRNIIRRAEVIQDVVNMILLDGGENRLKLEERLREIRTSAHLIQVWMGSVAE